MLRMERIRVPPKPGPGAQELVPGLYCAKPSRNLISFSKEVMYSDGNIQRISGIGRTLLSVLAGESASGPHRVQTGPVFKIPRLPGAVLRHLLHCVSSDGRGVITDYPRLWRTYLQRIGHGLDFIDSSLSLPNLARPMLPRPAYLRPGPRRHGVTTNTPGSSHRVLGARNAARSLHPPEPKTLDLEPGLTVNPSYLNTLILSAGGCISLGPGWAVGLPKGIWAMSFQWSGRFHSSFTWSSINSL